MSGVPTAVLARYGLEGAAIQPVAGGLINRTFRATAGDGRRYAVQRLAAIFDPRLHHDIAAVTAYLAAAGMPTPQLVRTMDGALWTTHDGAVWRVLTWLDGSVHERFAEPEQAWRAGHLLGRFHHALADLDHEFRNPRPGVHDLMRHLDALAGALERHPDHPRRGEVQALAVEIATRARHLPPLPATTPRPVHGDPKAANVLFADDGAARALIDLDTLGRAPVVLDIGDALRSWGNPAGEDEPAPALSLGHIEAALAGYREGSGGLITEVEWAAIAPATERIMIELAARFAADALNERYFAWDAQRFDSAASHNLVRARGQLALARQLAENRDVAMNWCSPRARSSTR